MTNTFTAPGVSLGGFTIQSYSSQLVTANSSPDPVSPPGPSNPSSPSNPGSDPSTPGPNEYGNLQEEEQDSDLADHGGVTNNPIPAVEGIDLLIKVKTKTKTTS